MLRNEPITKDPLGRCRNGRLNGRQGKAGESPGAFQAPGQTLLPAVRAVEEIDGGAFIAAPKLA